MSSVRISPATNNRKLESHKTPLDSSHHPNMDSKNNYIATTSQEFASRERAAFGEESRFQVRLTARMFDGDWANKELIPLLCHAYSRRPGIGKDYDFWKELDMAELIEPWHMACRLQLLF
jgi:hypothetical protein